MGSPSPARSPSPSSEDTAAAGDRLVAFEQLIATVAACRCCPSMDGQLRALSPRNGTPLARCIAIAEAPGRLGAGRSGIPLAGDQSGRNFRALCAEQGVDLTKVFVTNAVLCTPLSATGANRRPTTSELARCRTHLQATLATVQPRLVVTLGSVALASIAAIEPHAYSLRDTVGVPVEWRGVTLLPLYHPGARALIHRPLAAQRADYATWATLLRGLQ